MSVHQYIRIEDYGQTVSLILSRPPHNILNVAMMKEINEALQDLQRHATAKALVISADGKSFSAGVDVADHMAENVDAMMQEFHRIFELLHGVPFPTIAVVDGAALGGGCELAVSCDMVVASERAKFGQPEIRVGVFPPVAAVVFPRLVGRNRALELLLGGETISASEAERIGLINKVFPVEDFDTRVREYVGRFAAQSKVILEMAKQAIDRGLDCPTIEAIGRAEALYLNVMMKTEDSAEGLRAFVEKRQPVWRNR